MKEWLKAGSVQDVSKFYDEHYAKDEYEAFYKDNWDDVMDIVKAFIPGKSMEGVSILDAGCGHGQFLDKMIQLGAIGNGLEFSEKAVQLAKDRILERGRIVHGSFEESPKIFQEKSFDLVTCWGALEHTMNPLDCFESLMTLVKIGGLLAITVPLEFEDCLRFIRAENNQTTNERFASKDEWISFFQRAPLLHSVIGEAETKDLFLIYRREEQ